MNIAILTNWPDSHSTKRLQAAARKRGHKARAIDVMKCYVQLEQNRPNVSYNGKELKDINVVIPRLTPAATLYGSAIVRQFEMQGVPTTTKSLAIVRSGDKLRSLQLLARETIKIPKTAFANQVGDIKDLIQDVGGAPLVIKLVEGSQGMGVVLAETNKAAESVIGAFYELKANILVQEYIEEAQGTDIRAFVVGGKVVAAMKREAAEGEFRSNIHRGGKSEAVELGPKERKLALKAAAKLGLDVAGVDMLPSDRGPLVIEVNSAPGLEGIEQATGQDIAGEIIKYAEQHVTQKPKKDRVGA